MKEKLISELESKAFYPGNQTKESLDEDEIFALARKVTAWRIFRYNEEPPVYYGQGVYCGDVGDARVDIIKLGIFRKSYDLRVVCDGLEVGRLFSFGGRMEKTKKIHLTAENSWKERLKDTIKEREDKETQTIQKARQLARD